MLVVHLQCCAQTCRYRPRRSWASRGELVAALLQSEVLMLLPADAKISVLGLMKIVAWQIGYFFWLQNFPACRRGRIFLPDLDQHLGRMATGHSPRATPSAQILATQILPSHLPLFFIATLRSNEHCTVAL